jgi:hypothetical protein
MDGCFNAIRWFLTIVIAIVLTFIYLYLPLSISLYSNLGSPEKPIEWVARSGVYESIVDIGFDQALNRTQEGIFEESTSLTNEELKSILNEVLTEEWLEKSGGEIIEGFYSWIQGNSTGPSFEVSLEDRKESISEALSLHLNNKLESLPVCSTHDEVEFNVFRSACIPQDIEISKEVDTVIMKLLDSEDFLKSANLTGDDIKIPDKTLLEVPMMFSNFKLTIYFSIVIAILLPILLIIVAPTWRKGIVVLATIGLLSGAANTIASLILLLSSTNIIQILISQISIDSIKIYDIQIILTTLFTSALEDISLDMLVASLLILSVGITSTLTLLLKKK